MELFTTGYDWLVTKYGYVVFRGTEKECRKYFEEHKHEVEEENNNDQ